MSLARAEITAPVFLAITNHALTTESEEVLGLLLGDAALDKHGQLCARVFAATPQVRQDRRRDRVETSPEQIAQSAALAEEMTRTTGVRTRVVGWYHSHPHITVHPSHVDLATQGMYQTMDTGFLGIIVSCFNEDSVSRKASLQMTAFQAHAEPSGQPDIKRVPVSVVHPRSWDEMTAVDVAAVPRSLLKEEESALAEARTGTSTSLGSRSGVVMRMGSVRAPLVAVEGEVAECSGEGEGMGRPRDLMGKLQGIEHNATFQQSAGRLLELSLLPMLRMVQDRLKQGREQQKHLRRELEHLNRYDGMISQGASDAIGREQTSEFVGEAMSNVSLQPSVSQ